MLRPLLLMLRAKAIIFMFDARRLSAVAAAYEQRHK